jgi:ATP-dependent DNA ligase
MLKAEKLKNYEQKKFKPGYASIKYNGIHGICDPKEKIIYSRTPKLLNGLGHIIKALEHLAYPMVGEIVIPDLDFEEASGKIRNYSECPEAEFRIFNCIVPNVRFRGRLEYMREIHKNYFMCHPHVKFVDYQPVSFVEEFDAIFNKAVEFNEEGTCWISPDHIYQPDTCGWNWMKRVPFRSVEATVVNIEAGTRGKKYEESLGAFICELDNGIAFKCGIFKGRTDEWRQKVYDNSETWLGVRITVEFKAYSKYGKPLQPRFKGVRWDL